MIQTLDPIVESSLLQTKADGARTFVHDTLGDFFLAMRYAAMINSGELTVDAAWRTDWSYVEDKELWDLESLTDDNCRQLHPSFRNVLYFLSGTLDEDKSVELFTVLSKNYFKVQEQLSPNDYNSMSADLCFACHLVVEKPELREYEIYASVRDSVFGMMNNGMKCVLEAVVAMDQDPLVKSKLSQVMSSHTSAFFIAGNVNALIGSEGGINNILDSIDGSPYCLCEIDMLKKSTNAECDRLLIEYLRNPQRRNKRDVVKAIGERRSEASVDAVVEFCKSTQDVQEYQCALEALEKIATDRSISSLIDIAEEGTMFDEGFAFGYLSDIGCGLGSREQEIPNLSLSVRERLVSSVLKFLKTQYENAGDHMEFCRKIWGNEFSERKGWGLFSFLEQEGFPLRVWGHIALSDVEKRELSSRLIPFVDNLVGDLSTSNLREKTWGLYALSSLSRLGDESCLNYLLGYINDPVHRACWMDKRYGDVEVDLIEGVVWSITDIEKAVIYQPLIQYATLPSSAMMDLVIQHLGDKNIRDAAQAMHQYITGLPVGADEGEWCSPESLGKVAREEDIPLLIKISKDKTNGSRHWAAEGLCYPEYSQAFAAVVEYIADGTNPHTCSVIKTLAKNPNRRAIKPIKAVYRSALAGERIVEGSAVSSLKDISEACLNTLYDIHQALKPIHFNQNAPAN